MIIAIDANEANVEKRVGVNRFAFEVIWGIYRLREKGKDQNLNFLVFLSSSPRVDLPPATDWWQYEVFGPRKFWTWTGLVKRLYFGKPKPEILFSPSHYGPGFSPIPFISSIMDLGFLHYQEQFTKKDLFQLKYWTQWSAKRAKKIIAISQFTKDDIIKNYQIRPEKIVVAPLGHRSEAVPERFSEPDFKSLQKKFSLNNDYVFFLGTLKPSKNVENLVEAFCLLTVKHQVEGVQLVIAGKKGWLYESIFKKVQERGLRGKVIFTDFVSDAEAKVLMKKATVFAIPSFWEGFGIPALEAMDLGVPVVASDRGALPEVVGTAGIIVNPEKPEEIALGLYEALDPKKRKELIKRGQERAANYSWVKCSRIILKTIIKELEESKK